MLKNDIVCRSAIFPRFLSADVFDDTQLLNFQSVNNAKTLYAVSVISEYLARTVEQVHKYGVSAANAGNERLRA